MSIWQIEDTTEWSYISWEYEDGYFIEAVFGIVTQGCLLPLCERSMGTAVQTIDARERLSYFQAGA
jgi:hypothetical protein